CAHQSLRPCSVVSQPKISWYGRPTAPQASRTSNHSSRSRPVVRLMAGSDLPVAVFTVLLLDPGARTAPSLYGPSTAPKLIGAATTGGSQIPKHAGVFRDLPTANGAGRVQQGSAAVGRGRSAAADRSGGDQGAVPDGPLELPSADGEVRRGQ